MERSRSDRRIDGRQVSFLDLPYEWLSRLRKKLQGLHVGHRAGRVRPADR